MKTLALIAFGIALAASLTAQPLPAWLEGDWEGIGDQSNTQTQWLTLLSYHPPKERPAVTYPDLGCSGHWELEQASTDRLLFQEHITRNSGRCSNLDWIYIRPQGTDTLLVHFAHVWARERIIAEAVLVRRSLP